MRRTSKSHQLWPGKMIKMCPGRARPQLFQTLVRLIIFHLFRLRMAEIDPKKQDRSMAIHGWRMLYHLTSFDIIWCTGDVSRKTLELPYYACSVCWHCASLSKKSPDSSQSQNPTPKGGPVPHLPQGGSLFTHWVCSASTFLCKKW